MSEAKAHGIEKLTDYQHCRLRTEMYLGSRTPHTQLVLLLNDTGYYAKELTWVPALFTAFREAVDNAVDEIIGHKAGDKVWIDYDEASHVITVEDNGRGIPIDFDQTHQSFIATMVLTETKTGRNFGVREEVAGTNGLGISVVNFCSEWFHVEIQRDDKLFEQKFKETMFDELDIADPKISTKKSTKTGTKVQFKLSEKVFKHLDLPEEMIQSRVHELAQNNPSVTFFYKGVKIKRGNFFNKETSIEIVVKEPGFSSKFTVVPNFMEEGELLHSDVNNIPVFNLGPHMDAFRLSFLNGILKALEKEAKRRKLPLNKADVLETLLIHNVTMMNDATFNGQEKTRLTNEEPARIIRKFLEDETIFTQVVKKHRVWIEEIFVRCEERTNRNDSAKLKRLDKKKVKIAKLIEANSKDRQDCVLFLMEGDSAKGNAPAARDPKIHAFLPLRGKILNVHGKRLTEALESSALADIVNAVGISKGSKAVRSELRYGRLFIAHDMDPDGFNIGALIVNFLHTYWPELFEDTEDPFVNIFMTPYIIAEKGKESVYFYGDNYHEFNPDKFKGWKIIRAKGLGRLEVKHWEDSLAKPKLFPITKDTDMEQALDLIFNGKRADDRKDWMDV